MITYEWTLEVITEGDIVDNDFSDALSFNKDDLVGNDLGLVRNEGNEVAGIEDRHWAYVKDGKLPEYFTNAEGQSVSIKVPIKYHNELKRYYETV